MASSRVGARTTAWTPSRFVSTRSTMGMPKAAVFPVPVRDCTTRALPVMARGMVSVCTSVGALYPMASRLARVWAERSRAAKLLSVIAMSITDHYGGRRGVLASRGGSSYNYRFDGERNGPDVHTLRAGGRSAAGAPRSLRDVGEGEGAGLDLQRLLEGGGGEGGPGHPRIPLELPRPRAPRDAPKDLPGLPKGG